MAPIENAVFVPPTLREQEEEMANQRAIAAAITIIATAAPNNLPMHIQGGGLGLAGVLDLSMRRRRARQTHPRKRWRGGVK